MVINLNFLLSYQFFEAITPLSKFLVTIVQNVFWNYEKNINSSNEKRSWKKRGSVFSNHQIL